MTEWRRLHGKRGGVMAVQFLAACAVVATAVFGVLVAVHVIRDLVALIIAAAAVLWLVPWAIRKQFTGVFVSDRGVRVRETFRTTTFEWRDIAGFEVRPSEYARSGNAASPALWIITPAGVAMETPVVRGSLLVADMPKDALWYGPGRRRYPEGYFLAEPIFDQVVRELRADPAMTKPQ
jgi:hypothetical protein